MLEDRRSKVTWKGDFRSFLTFRTVDRMSYLLEMIKMGWERQTNGDSQTRGARVGLEAEFSVVSEPPNTSVH